MGPFAVGIVLFLSSGAVLITFLYLFFSTRHKERMALIDSGKDASVFLNKASKPGMNSLKFGLFLVFIGVALFVGIMLETSVLNVPEASVTIPLVLIAAGSSLLFFYRLVNKDWDNDKGEIV